MTSPEAAAFEQWLAEATRGLPQPLAKDVRTELEAHFEDDVEDYLTAGRSPAAARTAALADLGNAETVRHMLHKVHLSRGERLIAWITWLVPRLWQHRAVIATALFGLLALSVVVADHRHWIAYRGHPDPLTPLAFGFVLLSLLLERRLTTWSYPAAGYLLSGIWPWLFFEGFERLGGPFWDIVAPLVLPGATFLIWGISGLRTLRRTAGRRGMAIAWLLVGLLLATKLATTAVQLRDGALVFSLSALSATEIRVNAPWVLYLIVMSLAPVAIGLRAAQRDGLAAVLIPMGCQYAFFVGIADPTYHLTFYDAWQPSRTLHTVEALVTYLPALMTFLIAPLWMLRTPSRQGRTTASLVPSGTTLILTHILSAIGLAHTHQAYTAATWLSSGLESLLYLLPILLAIVLYNRFGQDEAILAHSVDNTAPALADPNRNVTART